MSFWILPEEEETAANVDALSGKVSLDVPEKLIVKDDDNV